jgi:hypothetical protein
MKFSYSAVWEDTVRLMRSNASLLLAIAGVFLFLPTLLVSYFLPQPQASQADMMMPMMTAWFNESWPWLLLSNLLTMVGMIAMYLLIFEGARNTVGGALGSSLRILPSYLAAFILLGFIFTIAALLVMVPAVMLLGSGAVLLGLPLVIAFLYAFGRLSVLGAVLVAERRGPIDAIRRSLALTGKRGWHILGLIIVVAIAGFVIMMVVTSLLGLLFVLAAGEDLGTFLVMVLSAAASAIFSVVLLVLLAALYRALAPAESVAGVFD